MANVLTPEFVRSKFLQIKLESGFDAALAFYNQVLAVRPLAARGLVLNGEDLEFEGE